VTAAIPEGMTEVTRDEFFAALRSEPRDIMPKLTAPDFTSWEGNHTREPWGWSFPGWKNTRRDDGTPNADHWAVLTTVLDRQRTKGAASK